MTDNKGVALSVFVSTKPVAAAAAAAASGNGGVLAGWNES